VLLGGWSAGFEKPLRSGRMRLEAIPLHEWVTRSAPQGHEEPALAAAVVPAQAGPSTTPTTVP
jgi:Amt family ammonium transporter